MKHLFLAALLFPSTALALTNPGIILPVADPCLQVELGKTGTTCLQGSILRPTEDSTLTMEGSFTLTAQGVAESRSNVFVYILDYANDPLGTPNEIPYEAVADAYGSFSLDITFPRTGRFGVIAYYETQTERLGDDATFLQVTGSPVVQFRTGTPPPAATAQCGDGTLEGTEQCDDGNTASGDGCSSLCRLERADLCGNGTVDPGEACDDGNEDESDNCTNSCRRPWFCGDGTVNSGEQCDDGNRNLYDGCDGNCRIEIPPDCDTLVDYTTSFTNTAGAGGQIVRGAGSPHGYFLLAEQPAEAGLIALIRQSLIETVLEEVAKEVCALSPTNPPTDAEIESALTTLGFIAYLPGGGPSPITRAEVKASVVSAVSGGCSAAMEQGMDPIYGTSINEDTISAVLNNGAFNHDQCQCGTKVCSLQWISGNSPLVFVTSAEQQVVSIRAHRTGGVITLADPPTDGTWTVVAGPASTPLYYEFFPKLPSPAPEQGWVVPTNAVERTLLLLLTSHGFDADEARAFIARDVSGKLPQAPFTAIRVMDEETLDAELPLSVHPEPERMERFHFVLSPSAEPVSLVPPELPYHEESAKTGVRVREFGATIER